MPPRARTSQTPWATGNRRTPPPWTKRVQRGFRRQLRKHPALGLLLQIAFAVLAVALLVAGLVLESLLFYLASALSALGALATRRAVVLEQERQRKSAGPKVTMPPPGVRHRKPRPAATDTAAPPTSGGPVKCTETGKPIEGQGKCECALRHVASADGVRRYGRPIGTPLWPKKTKKPAGAV